MPGFQINADELEHDNKPFPNHMVYGYTWFIQNLCQDWNLDNNDEIYLKECTLPEFNVEVEEYQAPNLKYKYAKAITWPDIKITFYDTTGILPKLKELKKRIWTPSGGIGTANNYKRRSEIRVLEADDQTLSQIWVLYGSWLRNLSWAPLTYADSNAHLVTATLAFDYAELNNEYRLAGSGPSASAASQAERL
jgi:hypothetical protein